MKSYGTPSKMVRVIADKYKSFECAVINGNGTSDWFKINSEVKQGCVMSVMSGFLLVLAIDCIDVLVKQQQTGEEGC